MTFLAPVAPGSSRLRLARLPRAGGAPSAPVAIDAGRTGVSHYDFLGGSIPGSHDLFVDVVLDDARGWHYSVGVMDPKTGRVKIVEADGGNARHAPTGHMVFSRGDVILAVPFDRGRLEARGAAVAVWSGLAASATYAPGPFDLTRDGTLFYPPGQLGDERPIVLVDAAGRMTPWTSTPRALSFMPILAADGRRLASQIINARGIDELWASSADHDDFERVRTEPNVDAFSPTWSPDGRRLAYRCSGKDGKDGVNVVEIDGGDPRCVLRFEIAGDYYDANSWARDGRVLAFQSDEAGKQQSYVIAFHAGSATGRAVPVRTTGSIWHQRDSDGTSLFVQDERNRLVKVPFTTGPGLAVGAPVEVCDLEKANVRGAMWAAVPDGRIFVGQKYASEESPTQVNVVLNWTTLLKQKMEAAR